MDKNETLLTVKDVANHLRLTEWTVRKYARDGIIEAIRMNGGWRFKKASVETFISREGNYGK